MSTATRFRHPLGDGDLTELSETTDSPDDGYYVARGFDVETDLGQGPTWHLGEDWNGEGGGSTDLGDPVFAIANGEVVEVVDDQGAATTGFGNRVVIRHDLPEPIQWDGQTVTHVHSLYTHLQSVTSITPGQALSVGDTVTIGQTIGTLGSSGYGPDPHLHFEITLNDTLPTDNDGCNPGGAPAGWADPTDFIAANEGSASSDTQGLEDRRTGTSPRPRLILAARCPRATHERRQQPQGARAPAGAQAPYTQDQASPGGPFTGRPAHPPWFRARRLSRVSQAPSSSRTTSISSQQTEPA